MKIPLAEQIAIAERCVMGSVRTPRDRDAILAVVSTLKWVERHQAELRVLGEFPIEKIEVLTPHSTAVSAIAQERDEGGENV
jgi:hypothetical protein